MHACKAQVCASLALAALLAAEEAEGSDALCFHSTMQQVKLCPTACWAQQHWQLELVGPQSANTRMAMQQQLHRLLHVCRAHRAWQHTRGSLAKRHHADRAERAALKATTHSMQSGEQCCCCFLLLPVVPPGAQHALIHWLAGWLAGPHKLLCLPLCSSRVQSGQITVAAVMALEPPSLMGGRRRRTVAALAAAHQAPIGAPVARLDDANLLQEGQTRGGGNGSQLHGCGMETETHSCLELMAQLAQWEHTQACSLQPPACTCSAACPP